MSDLTDKAREVFVVMYHPRPDNPPRPDRVERVFATEHAARCYADRVNEHGYGSHRTVEPFKVEN